MRFGQKLAYTALGALLVCTWQLAPDFADEVSAASHEGKMQYLVMGSGGLVQVLLRKLFNSWKEWSFPASSIWRS